MQPFEVAVSTQKVYFKMHSDALNNTIKTNRETQRVELIYLKRVDSVFTIQETMPFTQALQIYFF
jgi:hypothetical protein